MLLNLEEIKKAFDGCRKREGQEAVGWSKKFVGASTRTAHTPGDEREPVFYHEMVEEHEKKILSYWDVATQILELSLTTEEVEVDVDPKGLDEEEAKKLVTALAKQIDDVRETYDL